MRCDVPKMQCCNESLGRVESFGLILGLESSRVSRVMYKFQWERVTEYCSSH